MSNEKRQKLEQMSEGMALRVGTEIEQAAEREGVTGQQLLAPFVQHLVEIFSPAERWRKA